MLQLIIKVLVTALLIVMISELAKKNTLAGALLASLPIVSLLSFLWLYFETGDVQKIAQLSVEIFWLVLPSLTLFLVLPFLLQRGFHFFLSLGLASGVSAICYLGLLYCMQPRQ